MNGPFTPDLAHPISKLADNSKKNGYPLDIKVGRSFTIAYPCQVHLFKDGLHIGSTDPKIAKSLCDPI